ncbi:MAG: T9SS type A sorting domain-containing protein [Flavobacteriaceae bacterium]
MKKIFYLLTILASFSMQAQIELTPLEVCDIDNDLFQGANLTAKIPEILDGASLSDYDIGFYETYIDAQNNQNLLFNTTSFYNTNPPPFTIYARKTSLEDGTATLYSFDVVFLPTPETGQPINLYNPDGVFDLTENSALILNGSSDYSLTFHVTYADAEQGILAIVNATNFLVISSPQTIYVRVENSSGCYVVTSFHLFTNSDDIVYIPGIFFKLRLLQATTANQIAKDINGNNMIVDVNSDGEIQVSEALNVYYLNVSSSEVGDMTGIEAFVNLTHLYCSNNNIGELNLSNNINLIYLDCFSNFLTELDVSNNINLTNLICYFNVLTELNLSSNINLTELNCQGNSLTELDLSNSPFLEYLWVNGNDQLQYINIKNGTSLSSNIDSGSWWELWNNLPPNCYVCADDFEIDSIVSVLVEEGSIQVSPYCTFYPSGDYNTITGALLFDLNNDGICDEAGIPQSFIKVNITDGVDQNSTFTDNDGNYILFTQEGEFTLTPQVENPTFFNVTPVTEIVTFPDNNNNEEVVNFCITPNGVHPDLEVVIVPINPARPGFEATYKIVYRNKGNQLMSEDYGLSFVYNQNLMNFVSASVTPDSQIAGAMNWSYEDLLPFESREILVTMQINPPTDPENPVNIDDILTFTSVIMPQAGDENVMDNIYILNQTVVGAYDPNDITCIEGDVVDPDYIGEELHYVIRFENTGNFYAENVVIAMEIDEALYDVSSLRVLNASHNVRAQVRDNIAEFFFNQIYLDSGGHGNILLVMKSHTALEEGDSVLSKADIYFDYNYPIITNNAVTLFEEELSRDNHELAALISIYPNPATDRVTISSETKIKSVEWYDLSGRLIRISLVNDYQTIQDIASESEGIYVIKIQTEQGVLYHKIVKK